MSPLIKKNNKKPQIPLVPHSRENILERPALAEPRSRFNPARRASPRPAPGAWSPEIGAAWEQPLSPEIRRAEGPLTERVGTSEGRRDLALRRAEERSRSSAAADAGAASLQTKPEMAMRSDG